jgi:glycosyltransferase involved in cell wall biosynthesis
VNRPLNIVHILGSAYAGDWAFAPLKLLAQAGHRVSAVCPSQGPLVERLVQAGIPVDVIPFPRRMRYLGEDWRCVQELCWLFRRRRTQVVHLHLVPANLYGRLAAWFARVPVRVTQWPGPMPLETRIGRWLEMSTAWMDRAIIASSVATRQIYETCHYPQRRIRLIYYGISLEPFDPALDGSSIRREFHVADKELVIALIAYIQPPPRDPRFGGVSNKGHEVLIQAAREVCNKHKEVKFLIVGDSLYPHSADAFKRSLKDRVHELGLDDAIIFTGFRSDIPSILAAIDIAAVPSQSENVGGAVEPLLMEKLVVASNVGGLPDVVIDGETGFLVPPRDPHALAQAMLRALALPPDVRRRMGQRGRKMAQDLFDLRKTVAQTESLYYELLTGD